MKEASAVSQPLLRWWLKEKEEESPKTGLLVRLKQAGFKPRPPTRGNNHLLGRCLVYKVSDRAVLLHEGVTVVATRGTISPVFALERSRLGQITIWNQFGNFFLGLVVCGSTDLKKCGFRQYCTPGKWKHTNRVDFNSYSAQVRRDGCRGSQVLTTLQFAPPLAIRGWWHADVYHVVSRGLVVGRALSDLFLRDDAVDFWKRQRPSKP